MRLRPVAVVAALASTLTLPSVQGCTRTIYYAVINPQSAADGGECFRQCQLLRAGGTKPYLGCVRTCPNTQVVDEMQCNQVAYDYARFECRTEHNQTFSPAPGIFLIVIGVIVLILISASEPSQPQMP